MTNIKDIFIIFIIYLKNDDTVVKLCVYYVVESLVEELLRYVIIIRL